MASLSSGLGNGTQRSPLSPPGWDRLPGGLWRIRCVMWKEGKSQGLWGLNQVPAASGAGTVLGAPVGCSFRMEGSWGRAVLAVPGQQLWCPWDGGGGDIRVFDEIRMDMREKPLGLLEGDGSAEGRTGRAAPRRAGQRGLQVGNVPWQEREFLHGMDEVGRDPWSSSSPWSVLLRAVSRWVWNVPQGRRLQDRSGQAVLRCWTGPCSPHRLLHSDRGEGG